MFQWESTNGPDLLDGHLKGIRPAYKKEAAINRLPLAVTLNFMELSATLSATQLSVSVKRLT